MRIFRTVLVVLCLALATSTAAIAAPSEAASSVERRSLTSWVMSAFDWALASFSIEKVVASVESEESDNGDGEKSQPLADDEPPPDEIVGALDPHG